MAITKIELHWTGSTGDRDLRRGIEYTAVWFVTTNNKLTQSQQILNEFEASAYGAARGDVYAFAGDTATGPAYLRRLTARKLANSQVHWEIVGNYGSDTDNTVGRTSAGVPTYNPLLFRPDIRIKPVQYQKPIEQARYIEGFVGSAATTVFEDEIITPVNSAMVPFDDPLMEDAVRCTIEITRNMASYDATYDSFYQNSVNKYCFRITYKIFSIDLSSGSAQYVQIGSYTRDFDPLTAKIREIHTDFQQVNEIDFIQVRYIIETNPETWRYSVLDKGVIGSARTGDPDGRGGVIGQGSAIVPTGAPKVRRLTDLEDRPVPSPVLLDGDGGPLDITAPHWEPVYIVYAKYGEIDYSLVPFLEDIVDSCSGTGTGSF